jgi:hypothetical protein
MKKLFTILSLFVITTVCSQSKDMRFVAVATELHIKNSSDEWYLYQKNGDTHINIVLENDIITIYAESPTMYRLDGNDVVDIDLKSFNGMSFGAKELKKDVKCQLDILKHKTTKYWILEIKYDVSKLRYILEEK